MSRTRAVAIIVKNKEVLLMHRIKDGKEYWVFPGGGREPNESVESAVLREVMEETSLTVSIVKLLYQRYYDNGDDGQYYLCNYLSGEPKLGESVEIEKMRNDPSQLWEPAWISLDKLPDMLVYPLEIRNQLIQDFADNFSGKFPKSETIKSKDL